MAKVEDARDAEEMVRSYYRELDRTGFGPSPYNFRVNKQGYTWIVRFTVDGLVSSEEHVVHVNARTGNMVRKTKMK